MKTRTGSLLPLTFLEMKTRESLGPLLELLAPTEGAQRGGSRCERGVPFNLFCFFVLNVGGVVAQRKSKPKTVTSAGPTLWMRHPRSDVWRSKPLPL